MNEQRAAADWIGVLFIVVAIIAQAVNAMRKGKPPTEPEPRPQPRPRTQPPVRPRGEAPPVRPAPWRPEPVVAPTPAPWEPRPEVSAQTKADPDTADLSGLLDRLRKLEAARQSEEVVAETVVPLPPSLAEKVSIAQSSASSTRLQNVLRNRTEARRAIMLAEILQPPVALRNG